MNEDVDIKKLPLEVAAAKPKRQVGFKILTLGIIAATLLGAGGGAILSKALQKPSADLSPLMAGLETLKSENKSLKAKIIRLERDLKDIPKPVSIDVSDLKARLITLEGKEPQIIDPDLVSRLEAFKFEGAEALDVSVILKRLEALESRPATVIATPRPVRKSIVFPEAAILAILDNSETSQGWLKQSLKKHISVQSDNNPHYLMEVILENIETGNMDVAMSAFDKLPAEAKAVAETWRESLERN